MNDKLNFKYIGLFDDLELDDYYKTDSHFMINKIDKVALRLLSGMNNDFDSNYEVINVGTFDGIYKSRIPISIKSDDLNIIKNDAINNSLVYDYVKDIYIDFYDKSKLKGNDKYEMYLGGSTPLVKIYNNDTDNDRELIIFRDSFGSSLARLLVSSYKTITLVDTRYISPKILDNYIVFDNKDVLFIYNTSIINNSYSFSDNYLIYNGSSYYRLGEYFSFINMSQEYEAINPYYLDVSKMRFSYINDNNKSFAYEKASLICYDPDNLFKNLYNTDESSFSLELEINKIENNIYSFSFRDYLFVNKYDLSTSFIESKDSYMTDKLYFPINKVDQLKKMDFVIFVEGAGQVGYEMEYILNYTYDTELISLEKESEYNIVSHSATPDFTLGNTYYYG